MSAPLPTISIVTPSFNQGQFLEKTIRSVLDQGYPSLEYLVLDGGSTDGSAEIVQRYASRFAYSRSKRDGGQYFAIDEGFRRSTGEIMAWLNSDDMYSPWALAVVGEIFAQIPEIEWLTTTTPLFWDQAGRAVHGASRPVLTKGRFMRMKYARNPTANGYFIQQESTFWRRSLWERAGSRIDTSLRLAADFELWARFFELTRLYGAMTPLGGFRVQPDQKTASQITAYLDEAADVMAKRLATHPGAAKLERSYPSVQYEHDKQKWTVVELPVDPPSPVRAAVGKSLRAMGLRRP